MGKSGPILEIWPNAQAGTVLFYPGTMLAPGHYFTLLQALSQAGFGVAGIHLTGHGACLPETELRFKPDKFTFSDMLEQGLCAESWLHEHGYGPVAVAGHSQGGILTLAHAGASHTLKAAFAISAVFPQMAEAICLTRFQRWREHRSQIMSVLSWLGRKIPALPIPLPLYLDIGRVIAGRRRPLCMGKDRGRLTYPLGYLVSLFDACIPTSLNCPFCLINAANDALFTQDIIHKVFDTISAPAKEFIRLADGGHMAPYNPYFARFAARACAAFCAGFDFPLDIKKQDI